MKEITVQILNNYGNEAIYPADEQSRVFADIAGTRTLTRATIERIKQLGYTINVEQPAVSL